MKKILLILIVLVLIAVGLWFYFNQDQEDNLPLVNNQVDEGILDIDPTELIVFEVKKEKLSDFQKERGFDRFNIAKNIIEENNEDYLSSNNYYAWFEIASVQKLIGDYERAAQMWKWLNQAYSSNSISPANLGDLYKSFVIDKEQSEIYYLMALDRDKKDFQIYYGLYELYRYRFEDSEKALQTLYDGFENSPDNQDFVSEISSYLLKLDKRDEAEKIVEEFIKDHPEAFSLREKFN
ncbi:MAG: hypothetical protein ABIA91_03715 [Patescibacteria group bacterium]